MKAFPLSPKMEDTPWRYLLGVGLLFTLCLTLPQSIVLEVIIGVFCAALIVLRPIWGIFLIIAGHTIMSCTFELFWSAGYPIELISTTDVPWKDSDIWPLRAPLSLFPFQVVSFLLLPALIFHSKPISSQRKSSQEQRIIYTTVTFFFMWGIVVSSQAVYPDKALYGLSRFGSIAVIILYIIRFVDRPETLRKSMVIYCCAALIMSFLAYYATYKGFASVSYVWYDNGLAIAQKQALFNSASNFKPDTQGMLPGYGLAAKHEFSTFTVAGIVSSIYLLLTARSKGLSIFFFVTLLVLYSGLFYGPAKLGIGGLIGGTLLVTLFSPFLRRHASFVVVLLVALNIFSLVVSLQTRPEHAKKTAGAAQNFKVVNNDSEFDMSLKNRFAIMEDAAAHAEQSNGIGIGPEMLHRDPIFGYPHGHNFVVTFLAEYGVPALVCVIVLGIVLVRRILPIVTSDTCFQNPLSLPVVPLLIGFIAMLVEYTFDCYVWMPQIWVLAGLLWVSTTLYRNGVIEEKESKGNSP